MTIRYVWDHPIDSLYEVSMGPAWPWPMALRLGGQVPVDRYLPSVHTEISE